MLEKRFLKEWCGGCCFFNIDRSKCMNPHLNPMWKRCPCRNCLIKTMCIDECELLIEHSISNVLRRAS